jgi:hypothetical protein
LSGLALWASQQAKRDPHMDVIESVGKDPTK